MDYKIETLQVKRKLRVTTKFDVKGLCIEKIEGVAHSVIFDRYTFIIDYGEMFTYNEVVKNIRNHLDARNDHPYVIDDSKMVSRDVITEIDVSDDFPLERMVSVFKELDKDKNKWLF